MLFQHVFNAAGAPHGRYAANELTTESDEIERNVDRLSLSRDAKHAACGIELLLIHEDILPHPTFAAASRSLTAGLAEAASRTTSSDVCHMSPICMKCIMRLYATLDTHNSERSGHTERREECHSASSAVSALNAFHRSGFGPDGRISHLPAANPHRSPLANAAAR
jgi:hypothetical protein